MGFCIWNIFESAVVTNNVKSLEYKKKKVKFDFLY